MHATVITKPSLRDIITNHIGRTGYLVDVCVFTNLKCIGTHARNCPCGIVKSSKIHSFCPDVPQAAGYVKSFFTDSRVGQRALRQDSREIHVGRFKPSLRISGIMEYKSVSTTVKEEWEELEGCWEHVRDLSRTACVAVLWLSICGFECVELSDVVQRVPEWPLRGVGRMPR